MALIATLRIQNRLAGKDLGRFERPPLPMASDGWLDGEPLTGEDLRGQVVLIHFWAFECWNCYRSFPWLNGLRGEIVDPAFRIIGVHTPEFEREKDREAVRERARHFGLEHAIVQDKDHRFWRAMGNRYWPAWYVVDRTGTVRSVFIGETHAGDPQAKRIAATIRELLAER